MLRTRPLWKKAKAEGQVSFYANMTAIQPIMDVFNAQTGLQGKYTRISTSKFLPTVLTEFQAGKLMADVLQAPLPVMEMLKAKGVLASYASPVAAGYPDWTRKDDQIQTFGIEYVGLIYNTELVKPADVPTRYEDLADPKWKNKIVMATRPPMQPPFHGWWGSKKMSSPPRPSDAVSQGTCGKQTHAGQVFRTHPGTR